MAATADIWCVGSPDLERLAEAGALIAGSVDDKGDHMVPGVTLLLPATDSDDDLQKIQESLTRACACLDETVQPEAIEAFLAHRFQIRTVSCLDTRELINAIVAEGKGKRAILIHRAADYRTVDLAVTDDARAWAEQLSHTARLVCEAIVETDAWVLLDAGQEPPSDGEIRAALFNVGDSCGVVTTEVECSNPFADDPGIHAKRWQDQVAQGDVGAVIAELDSAQISDSLRTSLKIQVFADAQLKPQAVALLREQKAAGSPDNPQLSLAYARAAARVQDGGLAVFFLGRAAPGLRARDHPEAALSLSCRLDDEETADAIAARLMRDHPSSTGWLDYRVARAREAGRYKEAADLLADRPGRNAEAAMHAWLGVMLADAAPDYDALEAFAVSSWPSEVRIVRSALARHAQSRRDHVTAVRMLLPVDRDHRPSRTDVRVLLHAMSTLLVDQTKSAEDAQMILLMHVIDVAFAHLGREPMDAEVRRGVDQLLSTERSGRLGRAVVLAAVDGFCAVAPRILDKPEGRPDVTEENLVNLRTASEAWIHSQGVFALGRSVCPADLLPKDFHAGTIWGLVANLEQVAPELSTDSEIDDLLHAAAQAAGLAAHLTGDDRALDIQAVKIVGGRLARARHHQRARDVIEVVLDIAGESPARRRAAWFAYGETYRLVGDPHEAAMAFAIASTIDVELTVPEAWGETLDLLRVMRDLDHLETARGLIPRAERILAQSGLSEAEAHKLETLRLQIEQRGILQTSPLDAQALAALVIDAARNAEAVAAAKDDLGPITAVLAQSVSLAETLGLQTPPAVHDAVEGYLGRIPSSLAAQLRRFAAKVPDVADLTDLAKELSGARFARDAALDVARLVMLARRYLRRDDLKDRRKGALYALELLADQGVAVRDDEGEESPTQLVDDPEAFAATAANLSRGGMDLLFMGLSDKERLVRVLVRDGVVGPAVTEAPDVFSTDALAAWRKEFPYEYGFLKSRPGAMAANLSRFHTSVEKLGVTQLSGQRTLIIPDAGLSDLTMNLLPVAGEFAGLSHTIATAPSLSWLARARSWREVAKGPSQCWISNALDDKGGSTLRDMAERLAPDLEAYGVALSTGEVMPPALAGAELAIVGAHGGLARSENRFFRSVADEGKIVVSPTALANALAGSRIVVLFVCSGGRLDMEPDAQAAMGLARKLLDRGCSAVVGSPWPMSASIPPHWLKTFLEAWSLGLPVADATFHANGAVGRTLGDTPDIQLAMHVYGDPLASKRPL